MENVEERGREKEQEDRGGGGRRRSQLTFYSQQTKKNGRKNNQRMVLVNMCAPLHEYHVTLNGHSNSTTVHDLCNLHPIAETKQNAQEI